MADNINVTPGTGKTVAADEVGGVLYQRVKLAAGVDGAATDVSAAAPLPVEDANSDALLAAAQAIETAVEGTLTVAGAVTTGGLTDTQLRASAVPVSGTVTASGPLTDVQLRASPVPVIDSNSAALLAAAQAIQTAAQILDNIVAGNEAQVDIVAALPTGANTIGKAIIVDGAGADPEFAKEGDTWNAADHGMIIFARDTDTNPDTYRAIQVDADGHLKINMPDALPAGTNNIGDVDILSIAAGTNTIGATKDAGPAWTSAFGVSSTRVTSADATGIVAVTDAPTSGQKIVLVDIIVSVGATAMLVDVQEETSTTKLLSLYMAANSTVQITPRGKLKLATADKKVCIDTSAAGNVAVTAFYYSEA